MRRSNSDFFEEFQAGDFKRECVEEQCTREELDEIFENKQDADRKWKELRSKYLTSKIKEIVVEPKFFSHMSSS